MRGRGAQEPGIDKKITRPGWIWSIPGSWFILKDFFYGLWTGDDSGLLIFFGVKGFEDGA